MKTPLPFFLALLFASVSTRADINILGRDDADKVLAKFWTQNSNAPNTITGLNLNAAGAHFGDPLLPLTISGKNLTGTFTGTNAFRLQTWDSTLSLMQLFDFGLGNNLPLTTNTVSRTGFPEVLRYKTLNDVRFQAASVNLTGFVRANGSSYADAVAALAGTNKISIQFDNGAGAPTNYFTFIDGVLVAVVTPPGLTFVSTKYLTNYVAASAAGDVHGPSSSTANALAVYADGTGKLLMDSATGVAGGVISAKNFVAAHVTLTYGATVTIDFLQQGYRTLPLSGNLTLASSNLAAGRTVTIRLQGDTQTRTLSFPSWKFVGAVPAVLAANKTAILTATSFGNTDPDVVAAYSAQF